MTNFKNCIFNKLKNASEKLKRLNSRSIITIVLFIFGIIAVFLGFIAPAKHIDYFTGGAALIAASAITQYSYGNHLNNIHTTSRFYLEKYKETSESIVNYLRSDKPTRRVCWVTAAQITKMLMNLEEKITISSDKELLRIYQRYLAHDLYKLIINKNPMYFTGRDNAASFDEALKRPPVTATLGTIPKHPPLDHIDKSSIRTILDLMNLLWENEAGYKYSNETEFNHVVRLNYPNIATYLIELKRHSSL